MIYDFNFDRDKDFFKSSQTYKEITENINKLLEKSEINEKIIKLSIKLWTESTIKHNLDINMTRVDHINLLSDQNSEEILNFFGKILFKSKDKRTTKEFKDLREQERVNNFIVLFAFQKHDENIDIYTNIKNEFLEFYKNSNKLQEKITTLKNF